MGKAYLYFFTLIDTGVFYIGSTYDIKKRIDRHVRELNAGLHHNCKLQEAWSIGKNYDLHVFGFSDRQTAYKYEDLAIQSALNSPRKHLMANIGIQSRGGDNLSLNPEKTEIIKRRSETFKNNFSCLTAEERKARYGKPGSLNGMFGRTHTDEVKKILSEKNKGKSYCKGRKLSKEHIEKIRAFSKQLIGEKNPFFGKKHSEETIAYLRKINLGRESQNKKQISVGENIFNSCAEAAKFFKISPGLVTHRLKSSKYPEWKESKTSDE